MSYVDELLKTVIGFLRAWLRSGNRRDLLMGVPAIVAAVLVLFGAAIALSPIEKKSAEDYIRLASESREQGHGKLADLYIRQSALATAESPMAEYRRGLVLQDAGELDAAIQVMRGLAADDSRGHQAAHEWLLSLHEKQLGANLKIEQPTKLELAERESLTAKIEGQCERLIELDPQHPAANRILAESSLARGDVPAAIEHFAHVVDVDESKRLTYIRLLESEGQARNVERQARLAVKFYSDALTRNTGDPKWIERHRLGLAEAHVHLKNFREAGKTLMIDGKAPRSVAEQNMLAQIMIAWADHQPGDTSASLNKAMDLLEQAFDLLPNHPGLIQRIGMMSEVDGQAGERANRLLEEIIASGQPSWEAHFALGGRAYRAADYPTAEKHYERAYYINPTPAVINNFAYVLAHRKLPDFDRALEMINEAIAKNPESPEFRDTRGAIFMRMKRFRKAITDFEYSLGRLPQRPETHRALAEAYQAVGDQELAGIHSRVAESLAP